MAIDQFALIQGARQAEADNMARARFDVEQAQRVGNLAQNRQTWDLLYPQAQMNAEQNMAELAAKQKAAVTSADAIANSRNASAQYGVQDPTQYGVQPQAGVAASQMMQQIQGGGQSFGQPFNALQNQSLDPNAQRFDALAGVTQDVAQTQQYPQGVAQTQQLPQGVAQTQQYPQGVAQTQQYPQGLTDLQRVQAVPTQGAALMQQIQAPGSDPRVAAGAQAFQQSMGQALDQYRPGGSALVDALTMRENLAAQSGIAQKFFGNDRVAAAMAANTGFGSALTAPEEQQRARNIASMNLQAPGALESLGATRDMNGTYINYNGMTFGSDADFKTYLSNRAMAGANGAIDSLKTEGAGAKANLDLNIMRNVADIMIANAQVPNIEFHRGVNGNYIAVPKVGATPEQVAQGNAVAAQVNEAAAAATTTPAAPAGTAAPAAPAGTAGGYAVPFANTPAGFMSNKSAPFLPDSWLTPTGLDSGTMRPISMMDPGTWGSFSAPLATLTGDNVGNPFRAGGPLTPVDALPGGLPLRTLAAAAWPEEAPVAAIPSSNGGKINAMMNRLRAADFDSISTLNANARANYAASAEQLRTEIAAEQVKARQEQQQVYDYGRRLQAAADANPGSRVLYPAGVLPPEVLGNPYLRQLSATLQKGLPSTAPTVLVK